MVAYLSLGVLFLALLLIVGRLFVAASPARVARVLRVLAVVLGGP